MCTAAVPAMWYIGGWFVRRSLGEGGCRSLASTADRIRMAQHWSVSVRYSTRDKQVYAKESVLRMYFKAKTLSAVRKKIPYYASVY